jgi:hypothetical protein
VVINELRVENNSTRLTCFEGGPTPLDHIQRRSYRSCSRCVYRKPVRIDPARESRNVDCDDRAAVLLLDVADLVGDREYGQRHGETECLGSPASFRSGHAWPREGQSGGQVSAINLATSAA